MRKLFIIAVLVGIGVLGWHFYTEHPKQTHSAGETLKRGGVMVFKVTRTAVEAGMDKAKKEYNKPSAAE